MDADESEMCQDLPILKRIKHEHIYLPLQSRSRDSSVDEEIMNTNVIVPCNRWVEQFTASLLSSNCSNETSLSRSQIVASLYYKVLDYILREEKRKKPTVSLQVFIFLSKTFGVGVLV